MSRLATDGGGHFYFIEQPAQIPDFFTSELGEALDVVARDARLVLGGDDTVRVSCLNDLPFEVRRGEAGAAHDAHVRLGDLVSAQETTLVVAVQCAALAVGERAVVTLRLADRDGALFAQPMPVEWCATSAEADAAQPVNTAVLVEVAKQLAERARAGALEANRRRDFDAAKNLLKTTAEALRALAPGVREVEALAAGARSRTGRVQRADGPGRNEEAALRQLQRRVQPVGGGQGEAPAAGVVRLSALQRNDLCRSEGEPVVLVNGHYGFIGLAIGPAKPPRRLAVRYGAVRLEKGRRPKSSARLPSRAGCSSAARCRV